MFQRVDEGASGDVAEAGVGQVQALEAGVVCESEEESVETLGGNVADVVPVEFEEGWVVGADLRGSGWISRESSPC